LAAAMMLNKNKLQPAIGLAYKNIMKLILKYFIAILFLFLFITCASTFTFAQDDESAITPLTEAGENLDLQAVMELFMDSETVEDFEKALNDSTNEINNLDLNENGEVDYIRVVEHVDGDSHVLVLQVPLAENEYQDVATINIEKNNDKYVIQTAGDTEIYGEDYYVEPEPEEEAQANTTTVIVVMYGVGYSPWISPYRWRVYPVWWRPWRPHPVTVYRSRVIRHHRHHYRHTRHRSTVRAHNTYKSHRKSSSYAKQKNKKSVQTTQKKQQTKNVNQTQNKQQTKKKQETKNKNQTTTKQQTKKKQETNKQQTKKKSGGKKKKR
jgi:hypothetical protein